MWAFIAESDKFYLCREEVDIFAFVNEEEEEEPVYERQNSVQAAAPTGQLDPEQSAQPEAESNA